MLKWRFEAFSIGGASSNSSYLLAEFQAAKVKPTFYRPERLCFVFAS
jgi:hypothetical protein